MPVVDPETRKGNFESVIKGFSDEAARAEAGRCLECGCHDYDDCKLIRYANIDPIDPARFEGGRHECFTERELVAIERDQGKCILCNQCVRACHEVAGKGLLGLVRRGYQTVIKPEFEGVDVATVCAACHACFDMCPTGALKLV